MGAQSVLFFRMERKGCTEKILVGTVSTQQGSSIYMSTIKNGKEPRRQTEELPC